MKSLKELLNENIINESTHSYIGIYVDGDIAGEKLSCKIFDVEDKPVRGAIKEGKYLCVYIHSDGYNTCEFIKKHLEGKSREEILEDVFDEGEIRTVDLGSGYIEHYPSHDNQGIYMVDSFEDLTPSPYTYFLDEDGKWYQLKEGKKYKI